MSGDGYIFEPDHPSGWGEEQFRNFINHHKWQFAATMPHNPHEYTLRRNSAAAAFDSAVRYIREHGCIESFAGKPYKVLYFGDHKYWTMGAPLRETILINRKPRFADNPKQQVNSERLPNAD
jgi:hypothetical protein